MQEAMAFRQFEISDLGFVESWLRMPEVARWYPDETYIEDLEDHLQDDRIHQQIVMMGDVPFAYVQDYDIHGWPDHHLSFLPKGARGMDTFIGGSGMIGKGFGTAYLSALTKALFETGVPAIGIDPDPTNARAIRAYEKVGFRGTDEIETAWGKTRVLALHRR